ncbi:hypothetical protein [Umezawaea tangerina]|uniref:2-oxoacid dehydrogenase/acyltransferase catalytic subunit n=1 Tax=Umezawaea tangerina TaxID=84725 RepID=A0A2T0SGS7_9PSEU|nr:hypothetical protein [Umezawaea tangerina]PRY32621.1 hypothetical protein CLV43_12040 [Umezawaea tangerina]
MRDLLHHSRKVPSVPMQRRMRLGDVVAARTAMPDRVSWCAIFVKAYALVSSRHPELRRAYFSFPWPHLYEHQETAASFSVERTYHGEDAVFFSRIVHPEALSVRQVDAIIRRHKTAPLGTLRSFRRILGLSGLPFPVRRLVWWLAVQARGPWRARFLGTFAASITASEGGASLHQLSPLTTTLNYGQLEPDGTLDVRLTYDHRVLDGSTVARALVALEDVLRGEILAELASDS